LVALLDGAWRAFRANGFATATIASIAAAADVSAETVYKTFGSKAGLLRAIAEAALAGPDTMPTMRQSDVMSTRETNPYAIVRNWARFASEVTPRLAPVMLLIRSAAASSADIADLLAQLDADRLDRMAHQARLLAERGYLRPDVTEAEARDVMWAYTDPGMYELLVLRQEWHLDRFRDFLADALTVALLPPIPDGRAAR
jgi:AcrR family transcriptional regulator